MNIIEEQTFINTQYSLAMVIHQNTGERVNIIQASKLIDNPQAKHRPKLKHLEDMVERAGIMDEYKRCIASKLLADGQATEFTSLEKHCHAAIEALKFWKR